MAQALALKYRPQDWDDLTEQTEIKVILRQQLDSGQIQHCYLFTGGAGTGKTTSARILANEINQGEGNPIELDAASNNSVDDMRDLIQQAQTKSLNSEYKVFIIDECHMITTAGWNAILKLIEEPPAKSIFIFCTTDPQKIPKTILSRVQRYDFKRISQQGIVDRLRYIIDCEWQENPDWDAECDTDALEYLAKLADGGMRDSITLLDKCLAYSKDIILENVIQALGTVDYDVMFNLTESLKYTSNKKDMICIVEEIHNSGKDLKTFLKQYTHFLLDIQKYAIGCSWKYINIPKLDIYEKWLKDCSDEDFDICGRILDCCLKLNSEIKYSNSPKLDIETSFILQYKE